MMLSKRILFWLGVMILPPEKMPLPSRSFLMKPLSASLNAASKSSRVAASSRRVTPCCLARSLIFLTKFDMSLPDMPSERDRTKSSKPPERENGCALSKRRSLKMSLRISVSGRGTRIG